MTVAATQTSVLVAADEAGERLDRLLARHVAALSRSRLATWASIGLAAVVVLGWIVEAGIKWSVSYLLSHTH